MRLIKLNEVQHLTALSRATIYRKMTEGKFPKSVSIGERAVAWIEEDILDWIEELVKISRGEHQDDKTASLLN